MNGSGNMSLIEELLRNMKLVEEGMKEIERGTPLSGPKPGGK